MQKKPSSFERTKKPRLLSTTQPQMSKVNISWVPNKIEVLKDSKIFSIKTEE